MLCFNKPKDSQIRDPFRTLIAQLINFWPPLL